MSETQTATAPQAVSETQTAPAPQAPAEPASGGTHYEGRYIPYAGGCMGWYQHSGVLKSELPNNYRFDTALDKDLVRARMFERTGDKTNRRRSARRNVEPELTVMLEWGSESKSSNCKDMSLHGMRVQIVNEEIALRKDDKINCQIPDKAGGEPLKLSCTVMWAEKSGRARLIWTCGLAFVSVTPEQEARLKQIGGLTE
jgi:hypothetical protein